MQDRHDLNADHNLPKGTLPQALERHRKFGEAEYRIDHWAEAVCLDRPNHVLQSVTMPDEHGLDDGEGVDGRDRGEARFEPCDDANQGDATARRKRHNGLSEIGPTADLENVVCPALRSESHDGPSPIGCLRPIDEMPRSQGPYLFGFCFACRCDDDLGANRAGELERKKAKRYPCPVQPPSGPASARRVRKGSSMP